jgi:hypothetical protein
MKLDVMGTASWWVGIAVSCAAAAGCATDGGAGAAHGAATRPGDRPQPAAASKRPANADADAEYYRARAAAIDSEKLDEIEGTDFVRFRRGRLYAGAGSPPELGRALHDELSTAFDRGDSRATVAVTKTILADDQTDIRAHMLRGIALRKLGRAKEADFHRGVAMALINSIMKSGDGRGVKSAWIVFQVKEEYEVIKVLGGLIESQSLTSKSGRHLDIVEARQPQGGETMRVYFDITEFFEEQERNLRAPRPAQQAVGAVRGP